MKLTINTPNLFLWTKDGHLAASSTRGVYKDPVFLNTPLIQKGEFTTAEMRKELTNRDNFESDQHQFLVSLMLVPSVVESALKASGNYDPFIKTANISEALASLLKPSGAPWYLVGDQFFEPVNYLEREIEFNMIDHTSLEKMDAEILQHAVSVCAVYILLTNPEGPLEIAADMIYRYASTAKEMKIWMIAGSLAMFGLEKGGIATLSRD